MAKAISKAVRITTDVPALLESARAQLEAEGALKLSALGPKASRAALVSELVAKGFEVTKAAVRVPLTTQFAAALSNGAFIPLKSVVTHVAGSTAPEAKQALLFLVASGRAKLVLRGTEEVVVPPDTAVLSPEELSRLTALAKVVAKAARSKTGASLLRSDLVEILGRLLPGAPSPGGAHPGALAAQPKPPSERPKNGERHVLVGRLLSAVDATRDSRTGLSFVPQIMAKLRSELSANVASAILVEAAGEGLLELRPEGGINRLSEEELSMCPPGPHGTRLSWARRTESVKQ